MYKDLLKDDEFNLRNIKFINDTLNRIKKTDDNFKIIAKKRHDSLVKPPGSLGKLEDITIKLASIFESEFYDINPKTIIAFGADHGIYEEGISNQPQEVTALAFPNYTKGICSIGVLSKFFGSKVVAVDVGVNCDYKLDGIIDKKIRKGTRNFTKESAMTREEAILSIVIGMEIAESEIKNGTKIIGLGEMGICNTSPSSAIVSMLTGFDVEIVTGLGAGTTNDLLKKKINAIKQGLELNKPNRKDSIDILQKVGGYEIGALLGVILTCCANNIPIVLDGFISYAAALLAQNMNENTTCYMLASHKSAEPASKIALEKLNLEACLDMNMRLGEGSGAALFFGIIDAAYEIYTKVATFENSGVTDAGLEKS